MAHLKKNTDQASPTLPTAVRSAITHAQELSDAGDRHSTRSWEAARHVGDLSALAMVALAEPDTLAA